MNLSLVHKGLLQAQKMSPTALVVAGVVGVVTAGVLACRSTLKLKPVLEELEVGLEIVNENKALITPDGARLYNDQEILVQKVKTVAHGAKDLVVLYGPAVALGVVSISAIAGGHTILLKRNTALAAALTATEKAYARYRKAVQKEIGDEREREIFSGQQTNVISDTKAGTVKEEKTFDAAAHSQYARVFDESNPNWERNAEYNKMFLLQQQSWANRKLHAYGYLLLNDVYEALGFEKSSAGAVVGWYVGSGSDNYVDFGLEDIDKERVRAFINEDERSVWLDFNVDGVVYHLISAE